MRDFLYADNWVTVVDAEDEDHARFYLESLNNFISRYGIEFDMSESQILVTKRVEPPATVSQVVEANENRHEFRVRKEEASYGKDLQPNGVKRDGEQEIRLLGFFFRHNKDEGVLTQFYKKFDLPSIGSRTFLSIKRSIMLGLN